VAAQVQGTRERLIAAAAEQISEEGYDGAGVQAIARRAGLTNGAIYGNFRDRAELLAAAIEANLGRVLRLIDRARRAGEPRPMEVLELIGSNLTLLPERDRKLLIEAWAAAWRDPAVGVVVRDRLDRIETTLVEVIEQARAEGDWDEDVDPATFARFGVAMSLGYHLIHAAGVAEPDQAMWASLARRIVSSVRSKTATGQERAPGQ
jgi:AcrR family transcriptional regulator